MNGLDRWDQAVSTWIESLNPQQELCQLELNRYGENQHQALVSRELKISSVATPQDGQSPPSLMSETSKLLPCLIEKLTRLNLSRVEGKNIKVRMIQEILFMGQRLQEFLSPRKYVRARGLLSTPWACMGIKVLRLYIAGNPVKNTSDGGDVDDDDDDDEDEDDDSHSHMFYRRRHEPVTGPYSAKTQKRFFEQIGRLEKLEKLTLDTIEEFLKMDLESGLNEWESLKELKVLNLKEMAHEIPKLEVVRWMIDWETWPKLKILAVPYSQYVREWMETQRPGLVTMMRKED